MTTPPDEILSRLEAALRRVEKLEDERRANQSNAAKSEAFDTVIAQLTQVVKRHDSEITEFRRAIQSIAQLLEGALGATGLVREVSNLSQRVAVHREEFIEFRNRYDNESAKALEPNPNSGTIINQQNRLIELTFKILAVAATLLAAAALGFGMLRSNNTDTKAHLPSPPIAPATGDKP